MLSLLHLIFCRATQRWNGIDITFILFHGRHQAILVGIIFIYFPHIPYSYLGNMQLNNTIHDIILDEDDILIFYTIMIISDILFILFGFIK